MIIEKNKMGFSITGKCLFVISNWLLLTSNSVLVPPSNDENTCSKKCAINWETTLHDNNVKKNIQDIMQL